MRNEIEMALCDEAADRIEELEAALRNINAIMRSVRDGDCQIHHLLQSIVVNTPKDLRAALGDMGNKDGI